MSPRRNRLENQILRFNNPVDRNAIRIGFFNATEHNENVCIYLTDTDMFAWTLQRDESHMPIPPSAIVTPNGDILVKAGK